MYFFLEMSENAYFHQHHQVCHRFTALQFYTKIKIKKMIQKDYLLIDLITWHGFKMNIVYEYVNFFLETLFALIITLFTGEHSILKTPIARDKVSLIIILQSSDNHCHQTLRN